MRRRPLAPMTAMALALSMTCLVIAASNQPTAPLALATRQDPGDQPDCDARVVPTDHVLSTWRTRISPRDPEMVQNATLDRFARACAGRVAEFLVAEWLAFTPAVRRHAGTLLLATPARTRELIEALTDARVPPWSVDERHRLALVEHQDGHIRSNARRIFEGRPADTAEITHRYMTALALAGDRNRGRRVFEQTCGSCHRAHGVGASEFGPDLGLMNNRSPLQLLVDIVLPNCAIAESYQVYAITRRDDITVVGMMETCTDASVTLRTAGGHVHISRSEISGIRALPRSAMPEGLDALIEPAAMADLVTFLATPAH